MNNSYNKELDDKMSEYLDKYEFTNINNYLAQLGNIRIWIENAPYSYCIIGL